MKRVILESPYAGDVERNLRYLRACMKHCFSLNEAPFASHGLYTQPGVLDDSNPEDRRLGIVAGGCWYEVAELCVVYTDLGMSSGMEAGIMRASEQNLRIEFRKLGKLWEPK